MLSATGLSALAGRYPAIICDVWGVLHNGVAATPGAAEALARYRAGGGRVVLLTNAPRLAREVGAMLAKQYGVTEASFDAIISSGEVTWRMLKERGATKALHIGRNVDLNIYDDTDIRLVGEHEADLIVCTGFFDDDVETPDDYRAQMTRLAARRLPMICANPDLVVERGERIVHCAGGLARLYETLGGSVTYVGKPYRPVYDVARAVLGEFVGRPVSGSEILAIGDALPTDVAGAVNEGLDLLFITGGIHAHEFGAADAPDPARVSAALDRAGVRPAAAMPRLAW